MPYVTCEDPLTPGGAQGYQTFSDGYQWKRLRLNGLQRTRNPFLAVGDHPRAPHPYLFHCQMQHPLEMGNGDVQRCALSQNFGTPNGLLQDWEWHLFSQAYHFWSILPYLEAPEMPPGEEGKGSGSAGLPWNHGSLDGKSCSHAQGTADHQFRGQEGVFTPRADWHRSLGFLTFLCSTECSPLPGSSGPFLASGYLLLQDQESSCVCDLSTSLPCGSFVFLVFSHL